MRASFAWELSFEMAPSALVLSFEKAPHVLKAPSFEKAPSVLVVARCGRAQSGTVLVALASGCDAQGGWCCVRQVLQRGSVPDVWLGDLEL